MITYLRRIISLILLLVFCAGCVSPAWPGGVLTPVPVHNRPAAGQAAESQPASAVPATRKTPKSQPGKQPRATQLPAAGLTESAEVSVILGRPTDTSIAASLFALADHTVVLAYSTADLTEKSISVDLKAGVPQTVTLTELSPDSEIHYRLSVDSARSSEHMFQTGRLPGQPYTFTIDADPHGGDPNFNGSLYAVTMNNALADRPDFHINLGDTFMTEKQQARSYDEAEATYSALRSYFGIFGADVPLFLVNGNHEGELGWMLKGRDGQLPLWSAQLRQLYYPGPQPGRFYSGSTAVDPALGAVRDGYYAWTWGCALFVVLDPFWYTDSKPKAVDPDAGWGWTLGQKQYDWLKTTLESSPAAYKFVFTHHLVGGQGHEARGGVEVANLYEWGGSNTDGSYGFDQQRPGWGKPIHQLLVDNHVSAVFHGHDHVFVKQELDGIIYQEVPQSSFTLYNKTDLAESYGYRTGVVLGSSGHLRVTVAPEKVTVEYVRAYLAQDQKLGQQNRQVDYSYVIAP